jgi:hypothetical protein
MTVEGVIGAKATPNGALRQSTSNKEAAQAEFPVRARTNNWGTRSARR